MITNSITFNKQKRTYTEPTPLKASSRKEVKALINSDRSCIVFASMTLKQAMSKDSIIQQLLFFITHKSTLPFGSWSLFLSLLNSETSTSLVTYLSLSIYLFIYLSIYLFIYLFMYLDLPGLSKHTQIIDYLILDHLPKIHGHLIVNNVTVGMFSSSWILSFFGTILPLNMMGIFYDRVLVEGWPFFYKMILSYLLIYE